MKKILQARIRELMEDASQRDFSDKIGVKQTSLSRWLTAGQDPSASTIRLIATACNVSADWLLGLSDERTPPKGNNASASGTHGVAIASSGTIHNNQPDLSLSERVSTLETMFVKLMSKLDKQP